MLTRCSEPPRKRVDPNRLASVPKTRFKVKFICPIGSGRGMTGGSNPVLSLRPGDPFSPSHPCGSLASSPSDEPYLETDFSCPGRDRRGSEENTGIRFR